jgi:hypothetical protein
MQCEGDLQSSPSGEDPDPRLVNQISSFTLLKEWKYWRAESANEVSWLCEEHII